MLPDVRARSEEALFFAAPEGDADRALRRDPDRLQDPHGFHRRGDAGAVVGRARAAVPRVEVRAEHDDLALLVGARDLGDRVVRVLVLIVERRLEIELELDRFSRVEQTCDAVVVFGLHRHGRHTLRLVRLLRARLLNDHRAEIAASFFDDRRHFLVLKELRELTAETPALHAFRRCESRLRRDVVLLEVGELLRVIAKKVGRLVLFRRRWARSTSRSCRRACPSASAGLRSSRASLSPDGREADRSFRATTLSGSR